MVSKRPDAICLHCGITLKVCDISYIEYINMNESKRNEYREEFKKRIIMCSGLKNESESINHSR